MTALVALGLVLSSGAGWTRWLGTALLLGAAWELRWFDLGPKVRAWMPRLQRALPYSLVLVTFVALFWEPLLGRPPATRDHGIHYYQTHLLLTELLPSGRLWGWSPSFGAGYPFGESYPTLGYLVAGLAHVVSFGLVDERTSYAWGIAGTWGLGAVATGSLAAAIVRASPGRTLASDWAFAGAALLWFFDAGASRQGGWNYLVFHGVWPQMLSAVLWTQSLVLTWRAMQRPSPRRLALAAGVLGASVLAHPFGMLAAAASGGLWLIALWLARDKAPPGALRIWAIVHVGAVAVSSSGVLVFFGSADGMARSPVPWSPLGELSFEVITGTLFPTHWAWLGPSFLLGVAVVVRRAAVPGLLALLLVGALLLLGSHEAMTVLQLDLLVSGFKNLQFPRYTIELKPLMFAVAGVGVVGVPAAVRSLAPSALPSRTRAWLLVLAIAPFVSALGHDLGRFKTRPVGALDTLEANPQGPHERELRRALRAEASASDTPLKVAFLRDKMSGGTYPIFSITDAGASLVLDGHVPAVNFKHRIRRSPTAYDALGVTHVVYDRELGDREVKFAERLEAVERFGDYFLARYHPGSESPEIRVPGGTAQLVRSDAEAWAADIELPGPARVTVLRAPHVRWQATFDGEPIEVGTSKSVTGLTLMAFDAPGSGRLELTYRRTGVETASGWLALGACGWALLALARGRPLRFRSRSGRRSDVAVAVGIALVVLSALALVRAQQRKLGLTWQHLAAHTAYRGAASIDDDDADESQRPQLLRDLVIDDAVRVRRDPARVCNGMMGKDVLPGCSEAEHAPVMATLYRAPYLYRCVEFAIPPGGVAEITLGDGGQDVVGVLVRRLLGSSGKRLRFGVGKKPRPLRSDKAEFFVEAAPTPPVATLVNGGRHMERFCLSAAEVQGPSSSTAPQ